MSQQSEKRSPFLRVLDAFFQEDNIKWVLGIGVCILLGSSLRLVTLHWQEYTPTWKYLILLGYTVAVFGLGQLSYHRMALIKTGTVLMSLTVLLIPISFLALHWIQPAAEDSGIDALRSPELLTLLGINLAWSAYAARHIFRHFLRGHQPTFLVCYLNLCVAGAVVPGLPVAWGPILALALWAVFAAGSLKVNRRIFWLTEEQRWPRVFGFFPILLLGSQFAVVFTLGIASHLTLSWMGLLCTLVSLPILLTANTVARVFEQRTGGLVHPIPWSISGPLTLGVILSAAGVILATTGFPASGAIVPTAAIAAVAMGIIAHRTRKSAFAWGMIVCVMVTYQTTPVFFKELVLQVRDQAAAAIHESRLPYAFYGLTYAPLIVVFSVAAAHLQRRGNKLFGAPLQITASVLPCLLLAGSFTHPSAILPVGMILCPLFAIQATLFQRKESLAPAAIAFLSAAYGGPIFVRRVFEWEISSESALMVWIAADSVLFVPGMALDRWARRLNGSDELSPKDSFNDICQKFSLAGAGLGVGVWCALFGLPAVLSPNDAGMLPAVCITALLIVHSLRWINRSLSMFTLAFATFVAEFLITDGQMTSIFGLETLCGILLAEWIASYGLERISTTFVGEAFEAAFYRVSSTGLTILYSVFFAHWIFEHMGVASLSTTSSLLLLVWVFDLSRRTGSRACATVAWISLFLSMSANLTHGIGPEMPHSWWVIAWTITGLVLAIVRQSMMSHTNQQTAEAGSAVTSASRVINCFVPLDTLLPLLFVGVGCVSLLSFDWVYRLSGVLALIGLLIVRRNSACADLAQLFVPLLNWQMLVACAAWMSGASSFVGTLTETELNACGLPIAALAMISIWCFESRLRRFVSNDQMVIFHQLCLLFVALILMAQTGNNRTITFGNEEVILWTLAAWIAAVGTAFTKAVNKQQVEWTWCGLSLMSGAIIDFVGSGLLNLTLSAAAYLAVFGGITIWTCGQCVANRGRLSILSMPLVSTGYCLPLLTLPLAVVTQLNDSSVLWAGANCLPLLLAAAFYFWRGFEQKQLGTVMLSAVMQNVAFLFLWTDLRWTDPQLFMMPVGLSILIITELMSREIPVVYHDRLRFAGALTILVSPVFHIVTGSWWHILILMVAASAIALLAIGLRVRVLLYTSSAFLLADLLAMVVRGSVDEPSLLWIVGVLLGGSIIALGAACENHRETLLARLRGLAAELEQWS